MMTDGAGLRVWIAYEPFLFTDVLINLMRDNPEIEITAGPDGPVDIAVFRMANTGHLNNFFQQNNLPDAKLIAFSPRGDGAFIRERDAPDWLHVRPFGLDELVRELRSAAVSRHPDD